MLLLEIDAESSETESYKLGNRHTRHGTRVHQHADERTRLGGPQFEPDQRGQQVEQLQINEYLGQCHLSLRLFYRRFPVTIVGAIRRNPSVSDVLAVLEGSVGSSTKRAIWYSS